MTYQRVDYASGRTSLVLLLTSWSLVRIRPGEPNKVKQLAKLEARFVGPCVGTTMGVTFRRNAL